LDERVIGISLEEMRSLNRVVGIAGGAAKFNAILGAIRGRFINTLVTDLGTARKLLEVPS
jgi:DNA-binding transcriptional regulator LsrR (DeoR family)